MHPRFVLLLLCCWLAALPLSAATITGKTLDSKGEVLPFATVFVLGTTNGTTSNASGNYQLQVAPGAITLVCQYIGYEQQQKRITVGDAAQQINFSLADQKLQIKEVVVKASDEDPAYKIIRKTIKRRAAHLKQIQTFQTDIYLKGVLRNRHMLGNSLLGVKVGENDKQEAAKGMGLDSNGKGVLALIEEQATYYRKSASQERTIIHAVRQSGDKNSLGFSQLPSVISFYENNVDLGEDITPRGNVSPIADGALNYYRYHLEGEFREGGHTIFKIKVTPKRDFEPLFFGYIYIVDEDFALHSLILTATSRQMLEVLDTMRLEQIYLPQGKDQWVIKSQLFYPTIKLLGFSITGNFVTVYSNQQVNQPMPDSVFATKNISTYDKTANKKDTSYWTGNRALGLETDESRDYVRKDSIALVNADPRRNDSLRRRRNRIKWDDILLNGKTLRGKGDSSSFTFNSLVFMTNYNTVEGLNVAPHFGYTRKLDGSNDLSARAALRYGFSNTHFNAIGALAYTHRDTAWRGRYWTAELEGGRYVFQYNPERPVNELYNTFSTLVNRRNYLKIYERWDGKAAFSRSYGNGLRWQASVNFQQRMPLENTTDYDWAKSSDGKLSGNVPDELGAYPWEPHNAFLIRAGVAYRPGTTYIQYPDFKSPVSSDWPLFTLSYQKGIPNVLSSKTDYDKWRFSISDEMRMKLFGTLSYNLSAGGFLSKKYVSLPDLKHIDGNQFILTAPYLQSFQFAPYYRYSNAASLYGEGHIEYNLQGLITNKIPLLRQARWFFILGGNGFYASDKLWYGEAFVSIDNLGYKLFRFLRVDFVQSWDAQKRMNSGIRIGLRTAGLINISGGSAGEEW